MHACIHTEDCPWASQTQTHTHTCPIWHELPLLVDTHIYISHTHNITHTPVQSGTNCLCLLICLLHGSKNGRAALSCMYVCMYLCMYAYVCMYVYVCMQQEWSSRPAMYVCLYAYVCMYLYVCMYE